MSKCLVTTLSESVENESILAADEFVITVHRIPPTAPVSERAIGFTFSTDATVRMEDESRSFVNYLDVPLGTSVSVFGPNSAGRVYFPNPAEGETYKVIVSSKYALTRLELPQDYRETSPSFEINIADLEYCEQLGTLISNWQNIHGDLSSLKKAAGMQTFSCRRNNNLNGDIAVLGGMEDLNQITISASSFCGDIASLSSLSDLEILELGNTPGVYGNISVFSNFPSLKILAAPQIAGHPCLEGSISALSSCTALQWLYFANETKIYGDIEAFALLSSLVHVNISRTRCTGNVSAFANKAALRNVYCTEPLSGGVSGDIASFANLPNLQILQLQETGVAGDIADLNDLPSLNDLELNGTAVEGDVTTLSATSTPALATINLTDCAGISGDISEWSFPPTLSLLLLSGTNVTGDIGEALESCTTLTGIAFPSGVTGDVTKVYAGTSIAGAYVGGAPGLYGDLSALPAEMNYVNSTGAAGGHFSWSTSSARPSSSTILSMENVYLGGDIEKMLINQASCTPVSGNASWTAKRLNVYGTGTSATGMSASCRTACNALAALGYLIVINGQSFIPD